MGGVPTAGDRGTGWRLPSHPDIARTCGLTAEGRVCHDACVDGAAFGFLLTPNGQTLLTQAEAAYDGSDLLAVATQLRRDHDVGHVAAALTQVELRHRAEGKFGSDAARMFFTPDGLEQATQPAVAAHRARRLVEAIGSTRSLVDIGCGIGSDLMAFARHGLAATGLDRDAVTAAVAGANLAAFDLHGEVVVGPAERVDAAAYAVAFADPARRTPKGRTFDPAAYSPPWSFVLELLSRKSVVKVAPGIPHDLVPDGVEAEWVSWGGNLKEAALWSCLDNPVRARATVLRRDTDPASLTDRDPAAAPETAPPGTFVYEPDDAVIRAHLVTSVAALVGGWLLDEHLAYLSSDALVHTPFARAFEVIEVLPFKDKALRSALRARDVGPLTIKKRGIAVTPEALRSRLGLSGSQPATLLLSRTPGSAVALLVEPRGAGSSAPSQG